MVDCRILLAGYNYTANDVSSDDGVWYMTLLEELGATDVNVTSRLTVFDDLLYNQSKVGCPDLATP